MRSHNNYLGIEPEIIKQLKYHAWRLKQLKCFELHDIEDIEQDLLIEIYSSISKFDKAKSSLNTFINNVIKRRSNNLISKELCIKRNGKTISLDQEDNNGQSIIDYLTDNHSFEDSVDINRIINQLPQSLKKLCEQLKLFTITEVSQMSNRSRASIYRDLEILRGYFMK